MKDRRTKAQIIAGYEMRLKNVLIFNESKLDEIADSKDGWQQFAITSLIFNAIFVTILCL